MFRDFRDSNCVSLNTENGTLKTLHPMINRISGLLVGLNETCATIRIGGFDYEVLLPDIVRRQLQSKLNEDVSLRTVEYLEGNPQQGRLVPRIIGFMNEAELEFFDLISCQLSARSQA